MKNNGIKTEQELAFVKCMECTEPSDNIDQVLGYVCLRWSTLDKVDYSKVKEEEDEVSKDGDWFGTELFSAIAGNASVARGNYSIKQFMYLRR